MSPFHRNTMSLRGWNDQGTTERWIYRTATDGCWYVHLHTLSVRDLWPHQLLPYMYIQYNRRVSVDRALSEMAECCGFESHLRQLICLWYNDCLVWVELCCVVFGVSESEIHLHLYQLLRTHRESVHVLCVWVYGERVLNWRGEKERACEYRVKLRRWAQNPSIVWHTYLLNLSLRDVVQSG